MNRFKGKANILNYS